MSSLPLRFVAYAPPDLPCELFRAISVHFQRSLGWPTTLTVESAGTIAAGDSFAAGTVDMGWMCAPWRVPLDALISPAAELAPVAPAFRGAGAAKSFPLRAVLLRRGLPRPLAGEIARVLLELHLDGALARSMRAMGLIRFLPIAACAPRPAAVALPAP